MKEKHSIGQFIREARQEKGMGVDELSKKTKIHRTLLVKIEEDDLCNLPSKTYVLGFLRSISSVLDIPFHESKRLMEQTRGGQKKEKRHKSVTGRFNILTSHLPLFYKRREFISLKWLLTSLFLILLILLTLPVAIEKHMAGKIRKERHIASEPLEKVDHARPRTL